MPHSPTPTDNSQLPPYPRSLGTIESTKAAYEGMLDLKVATPQTVLNYGALLCEAKFFEEAFRAYERGVQLFRYPHVKDIWTTYLTQVRAAAVCCVCAGWWVSS